MFDPGYRGFLAFCDALGEPLEPHQRRIARAAIAGPERETVAVLPRGNAKSTTAALVAVHHVASRPDASVYVGAGSREQARVIGRIVERLARTPAIRELGIVTRHDELRTGLRETVLSVVPADGARAHGWERPTLLVGDELWTWSDREPTLLGAMLTSLVKNPQARFLGISTSAASSDSPLGRMRARALAQPTAKRTGAVIEAKGEIRWLEWSVPDETDLADVRAVKRANPAPWITVAGLREQQLRVTGVEYAQFHANRWSATEGAWLPPGAWQACRGEWAPPDEPVVLGVDIGGSRAASAVIGVTRELQIAEVHVFEGDAAVMDVVETIVEIAGRRPISEAAFDPWRFRSEALRLEREHRLQMVEFPQSHARMTAASENLHAAVVSRRLVHPGHPELDRHVASAIAQQTGRGWRLVQSGRAAQIDAAIALAMAVERADQPARQPVKLLGWI